MSKQIKDFINISDSMKSDFFVFQRVDGYTNETFRISADNLLKTCIKWGDSDIISSLDWAKVTRRPQLTVNLMGLATGTGTVDLGLNQTTFNVSVTSLDLSDVALGFIPVQQGGGINQTTSKVMLGWNDSQTRLDATVGVTDLGHVVFDSNLIWSAVLNKPVIKIVLAGKCVGEGLIDLNSTANQTLTVTSLDFSAVTWNTVSNKPTLKFNISGVAPVDINLSSFSNGAQIPIEFDLSKIKLNTISIGSKTNQRVQLKLCSSDYTGVTDADFAITREVNRLGKVTIHNTLFCNTTYSPTSDSWNTWNPLTTWTTDFSYINRVEVLPLLLTPNLIADKANISTLVVQRLEFNGTSSLVVNGVEVNLQDLIQMVNT
jgi:hypothetical protein